MHSLLSYLRRPYVLIILLLLLAADGWGVVHAFQAHGKKDGAIALVLPPYGLYRAAESVMHRSPLTDADAEKLSHTQEGRARIVQGMRLTPEAWNALLGFISNDQKHHVQTTMQETGVTFTIAADVPAAGPVELTIQGRDTPDLTIVMVDANRDQEPESLRIIKRVKGGKDEVHDTPLAKYSADDSSQFLLAWSLAWGTIAEELKSTPFSVTQ